MVVFKGTLYFHFPYIANTQLPYNKHGGSYFSFRKQVLLNSVIVQVLMFCGAVLNFVGWVVDGNEVSDLHFPLCKSI